MNMPRRNDEDLPKRLGKLRPAHLSISKIDMGTVEDLVRIRILDKSSRQEIEVSVGFAALMAALTGEGLVPCGVELPEPLERLKQRKERKVVRVHHTMSQYTISKQDLANKAMQENPGWLARIGSTERLSCEGLGGSGRYLYYVSMHRWVDETTEPEQTDGRQN